MQGLATEYHCTVRNYKTRLSYGYNCLVSGVRCPVSSVQTEENRQTNLTDFLPNRQEQDLQQEKENGKNGGNNRNN